MIGWIVRLVLIASGFIASFFVARDALQFDIVQMVIAVFLFTLAVAIAAFWPNIMNWIKRK